MLVLTDGGVNTFPDLDKKAEILENAAMVLQALGYEHINASCVCGAEQVNPKVQSTVDADALSKMTDRWAKYNMDVCGPVALDLAVSEEACHHKHYTAPGAGKADILLVPNYEVGNGIGKAANLFGNAKNAGIILGAKCPSCWSAAPTAPIQAGIHRPGQRFGQPHEAGVKADCTRICFSTLHILQNCAGGLTIA